MLKLISDNNEKFQKLRIELEDKQNYKAYSKSELASSIEILLKPENG